MTHGITTQENSHFQNNCQTKLSFHTYPDDKLSGGISTDNKNKNLFITPPKILLVEDDEVIQIINTHNMRRLGCNADFAKNGFEAIELFQNTYDIILLDIGLPPKNGVPKSGFDVVSEIRRFEAETGTKRNIIIALTAFGDGILDTCLKAGFDDFYVKPLLFDSLAGVLQQWLPHLVIK